LPPTLLKVIFKAVQECEHKSPVQILALEKKLNSKWRQTEDYKEWLRSKNNWVDNDVDFYFKDLEVPKCQDEAVVYEAPQKQEEEGVTAVCPVTGQKSSANAVCPVSKKDALDTNTCPITGQRGDTTGCPVSHNSKEVVDPYVCPVTGQHGKSAAPEGKCPFAIAGSVVVDG
jgi:hypothetical protein